MTRRNQSCGRIRTLMPMALVSVSYLALAAAIPGKLHAQTAPQAPEAGKTEAPASPPSAQPEAAPSSPAPAEKQEAPGTKSNDAPLPPVTIYPPEQKPQRPV